MIHYSALLLFTLSNFTTSTTFAAQEEDPSSCERLLVDNKHQ